MNILQINNRIPWPLNDGGNIGVYYFIEGYLNAGAQVSLLAMQTARHPVDVNQLPPLFKQLKHFETVFVDNNIRPFGALKALILNKSYNIGRFISKEFDHKLISLLQNNQFDIIHLDGLYLMPYMATIRKYSQAKVIMRLHNVEFRIWERLWQKEPPGLKKAYYHILYKQLKKYELQHINDFDLGLPISAVDENDYRNHGCHQPLYLFPFGIDLQKTKPLNTSNIDFNSVYHLGAMDWLPNQEGIDWFLSKVWPLVFEKNPTAKFFLAGRNMPERYYDWHGKMNIQVLGEVQDADIFESEKGILVVPLLAGGGVRIKIFNAMANGKAIVTTSVGIEGIRAENDLDVFIADTAQDFAQKILLLLNDKAKVINAGQKARICMETYYDKHKLFAKLMQQLFQFTKNEI